ncbi:MAG: DivIVA domain-containing protein [Actinobacteria bacterium]|nr:DivIVA domain-containing protein [Actinomycetota bacterium]
MALTPLDIHHKEFRTARFGGYNEEEVDSFLDLVADEFERMIQEGTELKQQIEQIKKRLSEFEEMQTTLQSALLAATKSAEAVKEQARQESEAIVTKAQEEADALVKGAQEQARQMLLRAENERQKLERSFARLKEIKKRYMQGLKDVAESHLVQVEELESMDESEIPQGELQPVVEQVKIEEEPAPVLIEEPAVQAPPRETPQESQPPPPPSQEPQIAERPAQPLEEVSPPPTLENSTVPQLDRVVIESRVEAPKQPPAQKEKKARAASRTGLQSKLIEPKVQVAQGSGWIDVVENEMPPSSDLIDEVLPVEERESLYAEFEELDRKTERVQRERKSRRDKREKHFFWE